MALKCSGLCRINKFKKFREQGFVVEELDRRLEDAKNGRKINLYFELVEPMNQTSDYKRAIGMLEMSVEDVIELTQDEYSCYVLDEWRWSGQFAITSSRYL